jgi:gas vesicle protein
MEDTNKLSYFCLGLGIGVAAGILFAPKAGEETRGYLKSKADEGRDYLRKRTDDIKDATNDIISRGKQAVEQQRDQLAQAIEAGKKAYRESVVGASS